MSLVIRDRSTLVILVLTLIYCVGLGVALIWMHAPPEFLLAATVGGGALMAITFRPYLGVQLFLLVLFFETALATKEGFTATKALGAIIFAAWLANVLMQRRLGVPGNWLLYSMILYVAWSGISVVTSVSASEGVTQLISNFSMVLGAVMFSSVIDTEDRLRGVYLGFLASAVIATVLAIGMYYAGSTKVAKGLVGNRNLLALYINLAVVCAFFSFPAVKSRVTRVAIALSLPILFLGMALTLSRAGFILLAVTLVVVWYHLARERGLVILAISAAMLVVLVFLLPSVFWKRAETILPAIEQQEDTFGLRVRLWELGLKMIEDRPILGVGPANFVPASRYYARGELLGQNFTAHNVFVSVAAETGLVGLGLLLTTVTLGIRYARQVFRAGVKRGDRALSLCALTVELMMWVMLGHGLTTAVEVLKAFWMIMGLSLVLRKLEAPESASANQTALATSRAVPDGLSA